MDLSFEQVYKNDFKKISSIYQIIKISGEKMYKEQGLKHWKDPYPLELIQEDCDSKEVFIVKDNVKGVYVHTFQLEYVQSIEKPDSINKKSELISVIINKFATEPQAAGRGIGKESIAFIENHCRKKNVSKICLDVYDKSKRAINFYENRGFIVTGTKPTKYFTVILMEKNL